MSPMGRRRRFKCVQCWKAYFSLPQLRDHFKINHGPEWKKIRPSKPGAIMALSRKDILSGPVRLPVEHVPVKDWGGGGVVLLQGGDGEDRDEYESKILITRHNAKGAVTSRDANLKIIRRTLVSMACVDEPEGFEMPKDGRHEKLPRLFTPEDVDELAKRSSRDLDVVFTRAAALWGISKEDVAELSGESRAVPSGKNGTVSRESGVSLAGLHSSG